jgi:membrane protein
MQCWCHVQRFAPWVGPVELIKRTAKEVVEDNCTGIAAELAYYFALALFPALLFLVALASYLPYNIVNDVIAALDPIAPPEVLTIIRKQLESIVSGDATSLVTIGILGALWSSSGAMTSIVSALNTAYDIPETRPWWKVRLVSIALTIGLALFVLFAFMLIVAGPNAGHWLANCLGCRTSSTRPGSIRDGLSHLLCNDGIAIALLRARRGSDWVWITPGSILTTMLWVLFSMTFRLYVTRVGDYAATWRIGRRGDSTVVALFFRPGAAHRRRAQ